MYQHGIRVEEVATSVPRPSESLSGIPVIFGTAPVNLTDNPSANRLVYAGNYTEAVQALGYSEDFEKYTLCQSIYAHFKKYKIAPVIFVNVLDPDKHTAEVSEASYAVTNNQTVVNVEGLLLKTLVVKNGEDELSPDTDYIATFNEDGYVLLTFVSSTVVSVKVSGKRIDATKVTEADIIGAYDEETGKETGLELIRQVFPSYGVYPGMIVAPGWSKKKNVAAVMEAKCEKINGCFSCMAVIDVDTALATKYTDVANVKTNTGVSGASTMLVWPMVKCDQLVLSYSAVLAARTQAADSENDGVPANPSNKALNIDAICLADGTEVVLDETQANTLNAEGVITAVNFNGFKTWGNNTAGYPAVTDPKDRWIGCRRFFSWWENNFIVSYHDKIDSNADYRLIESIVDAENIKGNSYKAQGKCAGAYIEFNKDENTTASIIDGHMVFKMHLAPYTPAEDILNVFEFDVDALNAGFEGGEE